MNAVIVFFVIGAGAAVALLANRLATRGKRPGSHDRDGGAAYGNWADDGGAGRDDGDAGAVGAGQAGGDGGSSGGGGGDGGRGGRSGGD